MTVTLTASATADGATLRIAYRLENATDDTVHALTVVERWTSDGLVASPDVVYTDVADGRLRLLKAALPVPDDTDVEAPVVPLLVPVAPGTSLSEDIALDLPLAPYHPYDELEEAGTVTTYDEVELVVGWLPAHVPVRTGTRPDGTVVTSAEHGDVLREQQLLVAPLEVSVPMTARSRR